MNSEYGRLSTISEQLIYDMLQELKKLNENLSSMKELERKEDVVEDVRSDKGVKRKKTI